MDTNKILSADLLDLIFDDRNKEYGAYALRKAYDRRISKALMFTGTLLAIACSSIVLANKFSPKAEARIHTTVVTITDLTDDPKKPEPIKEPKKEIKPQTQTEKLTVFKITKENVVDPPPTQADIADSKIDIVKKEGTPDDHIATPQDLDVGRDIVAAKIEKDPPIFYSVQVEAKFNGNWEKFLTRNLNPDVPIENGAPAGSYQVIVQFVVDVDGTVSDIKALTNLGYGVEQEAIRVLRKAAKWEPAIQNGRQVKAYRRQAITFLVTGE